MEEKEFNKICKGILSESSINGELRNPAIKYFTNIVRYIREKSKDNKYEVIPHSYIDYCNPHSNNELGKVYCIRVINTESKQFKDIFIKNKLTDGKSNTRSITGVETDDVLDLTKDEITLSLDNYKIKINVKEDKKEMIKDNKLQERIKKYTKVYEVLQQEGGNELSNVKIAKLTDISASLIEYIRKYLNTYGIDTLEEDILRTNKGLTDKDKAKMMKLFKEGKSRKAIAIELRHVHHGTVTKALKGLKPEDVKVEECAKPKRKAVKRSKSENKELKQLESENKKLKAELDKLEAKNKKLEKVEVKLTEKVEDLKDENKALKERIAKYENATLFERVMKLRF